MELDGNTVWAMSFALAVKLMPRNPTGLGGTDHLLDNSEGISGFAHCVSVIPADRLVHGGRHQVPWIDVDLPP